MKAKDTEKPHLLDTCNLPQVPERKLDDNIDPNRQSLVRYNEKKWVNHTILHYHFLENNSSWRGLDSQKQAVRDAFQTWKDLGIGLVFEEVSDPNDAEIRIGFEPGGSWSYVGRDAVDFVPDPAKRTMNFGWDLTTPYGKDTALHEIGHALGFPHEHQNPNAGIVWDEDAVYNYFGGSPNNWSRQQTYHNVIRKISPAAVEGSNWDRDSIMHYWFDAGLIRQPSEYQNRPLIPEAGLSEVDISEVRKFYPPKAVEEDPLLEPFLSQKIEIEPSEQLDFTIKPPQNRDYTIQTFGNVDTVMVLFEDMNGTQTYLAGDDDSGYLYNSKISVRLFKNRSYTLRLRLYSSFSSGSGAVMLW
ncbi:M12 family metallopeptidase [Flammeovirgaceae bacterium SG7u.111]|nr:M12 family metallopeptidase [Flammeovirgaceae bacterium SG7u.132]WPO36570.1 M12 family metallopeptidase [Flammeovirgaceae bacterium SG7u.111]